MTQLKDNGPPAGFQFLLGAKLIPSGREIATIYWLNGALAALHQVPDSVANPGLVSEPCTGRAANYCTERAAKNGTQTAPHCRTTNRASGLRIVIVPWHEVSLVTRPFHGRSPAATKLRTAATEPAPVRGMERRAGR
jgi:hypothetical protein